MEKLDYKTFSNLRGEINLFVHVHHPVISRKKVFLFLNPLFDEKKRSQKFQASTARALQNMGFTVVRFDYYGTGDSCGDFSELTVDSCLNDCKNILDFIKDEIKIETISVLGIRFGASLALKLADINKEIDNIFLIEPIVSGKRYLMELSLRRKAFFKLNGMKDNNEEVIINRKSYIDHQGYLISDILMEELKSLDAFKQGGNNQGVIFFSLDQLNYKNMLKLKEALSVINEKIKLIKNSTPTFWSTMEMTKTEPLTTEILKYV